jgi:hypothetical protein
VKRTKEPSQPRDGGALAEPLPPGTQIRDVRGGQTGVILDHACQYAHPKADPVYNYLIRWEDGQIQAVAEAALSGGHGLEVIES